ncbi:MULTISPECIES: BREX system serine/threonine kinase PglW [Streptomyces]|uniref:BREX system serine/threonine kinase PglW n=1 Tax=Streptomyces TaxID=1883 RepID=UPI00069C72FD|nr:BREX system serine/threonine kinase PglW [Streptomyces sp. SID7805]MYU55018.1 BREX system serine/threonine kinase PglW [Streptomyces sp. SID7805]
MKKGRWTAVAPSEYPHEQAALERILTPLPDDGPWRAWSNFTFVSQTGHVREVDLLVVTPGGVHMIELKSLHGRVERRGGQWVQISPGNRRGYGKGLGDPLRLTNQKSKELASLLRRYGAKVYITEGVCFTEDGLDLALPPHELNAHIYNGIPALLAELQLPPREDRFRISSQGSADIGRALAQVGIQQVVREAKVGPFILDKRPFDTGATWADYAGRHEQLSETVRVRVHLRPRNSSSEARKALVEAARREADTLKRIHHPGVVRIRDYYPSDHEAGPALTFDHHPERLHLDEFLDRWGGKLNLEDRLALVRQIAEAIKYAHAKRLYHRALTPRSIHVIPRHKGGAGRELSEEERWQRPVMQVSDWQLASRTVTSSGVSLAPSTVSDGSVDDASDPYLAPELTAPKADPARMDVYGIGTLAYLLTTGSAPAATRAELQARAESGERLAPSAVEDGIPPFLDDLIDAATAQQPDRRLDAVGDFLEMLAEVEEDLRPAAVPDDEQLRQEEPADDLDPLEVPAGTLLQRRWRVRRRLGTGSTARALLVLDEQQGKNDAFAVLKVALDDDKSEALQREAETLGRLRDSSIIRLLVPGTFTVGGRTVLATEYVGNFKAEADDKRDDRTARDETMARVLGRQGRLTMDDLERYSDNLFNALYYLEGESVWHRDIKPDNIAIRIRPNGTRQALLLDFSLAAVSVRETGAGTSGYLDPFVGTVMRNLYDDAAERYALAVTLHQMASNELPQWGDGSVTPRMTDPKDWPYPTIASEGFEDELRDGLTEFFRKALNRDAKQRHKDLRYMRTSWQRVFQDAQRLAASAGHESLRRQGQSSAPDGEADTADLRDQLAEVATRETPLVRAGLTPSADSILRDMKLTTVGEFLDRASRTFINRPGLGARTRTEIQRRQKEWRARLGSRPEPEPQSSPEERTLLEAQLERIVGVVPDVQDIDHLLARIVPPAAGRTKRLHEVAVHLLRAPGADGTLPDLPVWPLHKDATQAVGFADQSTFSRELKKLRKLWAEDEGLLEVRAAVLEQLRALGRVASVDALAGWLLGTRGYSLGDPDIRRAAAFAVLRALIEREQQLPVDDRAFQHFAPYKVTDPVRRAGFLALEVDPDNEADGPDTPAAPALLSYVKRLGDAADRLAGRDSLPGSSTVLAELSAVRLPEGEFSWDDRRVANLAAQASQNAALSPRIEIYPRDLGLVRALRLSQAGLVRVLPGLPEQQQPGLPLREVLERVNDRFPALAALAGMKDRPEELLKALREAGFDLKYAADKKAFLPRKFEAVLSHTSALSGSGSGTGGPLDQESTAARADAQLARAARRDGLRVLTVRARIAPAVGRELRRQYGVRAVSVTELFLKGLRGDLTPGRAMPKWEVVVKADVLPAGQRPTGFTNLVGAVWQTVQGVLEGGLAAGIEAGATGQAPVLLTDAAVFARYDGMHVLDRLTALARRGGRPLWVLVAQDDETAVPKLAGRPVPYLEAQQEWIPIPKSWTRMHEPNALEGVTT